MIIHTLQISKIVTTDEVAKNDYNLSPSRYVVQNGEDETLPLDEAVVLLKEAEEECQEADRKLRQVLSQLGVAL
jgi:type I restriction enzyme M protein